MKKFFALAATALFILTSCSSDDAQPTNPGTNPDEGVLLKKSIETGPDGVITAIYNYEGTKLLNITYSDGSKDVYTYDSFMNVISDIEEYDENNNLVASSSFTYDGFGRLISMHDSVWATTYTYNEDGTISFTRGQNFQYGVIYDNKVSTYTVHPWGGSDTMLWDNYEYDDKNDPLKNVMGMDRLAIAYGYPKHFGNNLTNNYTTREDGSFNQQLYTASFTYNSQGYPVTEHRDDLGYISDFQYFYE